MRVQHRILDDVGGVHDAEADLLAAVSQHRHIRRCAQPLYAFQRSHAGMSQTAPARELQSAEQSHILRGRSGSRYGALVCTRGAMSSSASRCPAAMAGMVLSDRQQTRLEALQS